MEVFVVTSTHVESDSTEVEGVYSSREAAELSIAEYTAELKEMCETDDVSDIMSYEIVATQLNN